MGDDLHTQTATGEITQKYPRDEGLIWRTTSALKDIWRGQSESIGVIALAAIVIILAAAIGVFLLGDLNTDEEEQILVNIEIDVEPESVTISHRGGGTLDASDVGIIIEKENERIDRSLAEFEEGPDEEGRFTSGESFQTFDGTPFTGDIEVLVVHEPTNSVLASDSFEIDADMVVLIDEISTNSPVFATENELTVDYIIENDNAPAEQSISLVLDGETVDEETRTVNPDNSHSFQFDEIDISSIDLYDGLSVEVVADNAFDRQDLSGPDFAVSIDDVDIDEITATVDYSVENLGEIGDEQDVVLTSYDSDGDEIESQTETSERIAGEEGETYTADIEVEAGGTLTVGSEDDSDEITIGSSDIDIAITDVSDAVSEGQNITLEYEVTNDGEVAGERDVIFAIDDESVESHDDLLIEADDSVTGMFNYTTDSDDLPEVNVSVDTGDANDSAAVTVIEAFDVSLDAPAEVDEDKELEVEYTVTNDDDQTDAQDIVFKVDGEEIDIHEAVELDPSDSLTDTFTYTPDEDDVPEITVSVESSNNTASQDVTVLANPFYEVALTDVPDEVPEGDDLVIEYEVENEGDQSDTQEIVFEVDGEVEGTESVSLDGKESTTETFTYTTVTDDVPEVTVSVASDNTTDSADVTVLADPFFEIIGFDVPDEVEEGEEIEVEYEIENTGDQTDTQDIDFLVNGDVVETDENLELPPEGGITATGNFTYTTDNDDLLSVNVGVSTNNDSESATVGVTPDAVLLGNLSAETGDVGDTVTVAYDVTAVGESEETIDAYELRIEFDDSILEFQGIGGGAFGSPIQESESGGVIEAADTSGTHETPLEPMIELEFEIIADGVSPIEFGSGNEINDPDLETYDTAFVGGSAGTGSGSPTTLSSSSSQAETTTVTPGEITEVPEYDVGDVTETGSIGPTDVEEILYMLFNEPPEGVNPTLADVTRNGEIELADAQAVAQYVVGTRDEANVEVSVLDVPTEHVAGEELTGTATLTNTGGLGTIQGINYTLAETNQFDDLVFDEQVHIADLGIEERDNEIAQVEFTVEPTTAGEHTQGLLSNEDNATAPLTISPAELDSVVLVDPEEDQTITAGESAEFSAEALDEFGNVIEDEHSEFTWLVDGEESANITSDGEFVGTTVGEYEVSAEFGGVESGILNVTVELADVDTVTISPDSTTVTAGEDGAVDFSAVAEDEFGNEITSTDGDFTWSADAGTVDNTGSYDAPTTVGVYTGEVTVEFNGVEDTADVTVEPADVDTVTISPDSTTVTAGEVGAVDFSAVAEDEFGNEITSTDSDFTWAADAGTVDNTGSYDAPTTVGVYTGEVTVEFNGVEDTADVTVDPAVTDTVEISPSSDQEVDPTVGETVTFSATALDEFGNVVESSDSEFSWAASGGSISGDGFFDETTPGDYGVTAEFGGVTSDATTVTVLEPPEFEISITNTNEPVEGDTLTVDVNIENVGELPDTQDINLDVSGLGSDTVSDVNLIGGQSTSETLSIDTSVGEAGSYTAEVSTNNDTDSTGVTVLQQAEFLFDSAEFSYDETDEEFTVDYTIDNIGEVADTQTVEFTVVGVGSSSTSESIDAESSTSGSLSQSIPAPGTYDLEVTTEDDTETGQITVDGPDFVVDDITLEDDPVDLANTGGSTSADVSFTVRNVGDFSGSDTVSLSIDGSSEDSATVAAGADETDSGTLTGTVALANTPSATAEISIDGDSESGTIDIAALELISISNADSSVEIGDSFTVDYTVENIGSVSANDAVDLFIDGSAEDADSVNPSPGDTQSGTLSKSITLSEFSDGDTVSFEVGMFQYFGSESGSFDVTGTPDFQVTSFSAGYDQGSEELTASYTVENQGTAEDTQNVRMIVDGSTESTHSRTLAPNEDVSGTLTYSINSGGSYEIQVATDDDSSSTSTVSVDDATFQFTDFDASYSSSTEEISISYTVQNQGDVTGSDTVVFAVDGSTEDTDSVSLGPGDSTNGGFAYSVPETGSYTVSVSTSDDSESDSFTIDSDFQFTYEDAFFSNGDLVADYDIENQGDITDTQTVTMDVDGTERDSETYTLSPGDSETQETLTYSISSGGSYNIYVSSEDDSYSQTVNVDDPYFSVSGASASYSSSSETATISFNVENTGDFADTQYVTASGDSDSTGTWISLGPGDSTSDSLTIDINSGGSQTITVSSDDDSDSDSIYVQPADFSIDISDYPNWVEAGDTIHVDVTLQNNGGISSWTEVELVVDGWNYPDSSWENLGAGESTTVSLSYSTDSSDAKEDFWIRAVERDGNTWTGYHYLDVLTDPSVNWWYTTDQSSSSCSHWSPWGACGYWDYNTYMDLTYSLSDPTNTLSFTRVYWNNQDSNTDNDYTYEYSTYDTHNYRETWGATSGFGTSSDTIYHAFRVNSDINGYFYFDSGTTTADY